MKEITSIFTEIEKLADIYNIKSASSVSIKFNKDFGIVKFKNAQSEEELNQSTQPSVEDENKSLDQPNVSTTPAAEVGSSTAPVEQESTSIEDSPEFQQAATNVETKFEPLAKKFEGIMDAARKKIEDGLMPEDIKIDDFVQQEVINSGILDEINTVLGDADVKTVVALSNIKEQPKIPLEVAPKETSSEKDVTQTSSTETDKNISSPEAVPAETTSEEPSTDSSTEPITNVVPENVPVEPVIPQESQVPEEDQTTEV